MGPLRGHSEPVTLGQWRPTALHDTTGHLGMIDHPAPNVEAGDVIVLMNGREALVTSPVEAYGGPLAALLEVVVVVRSPG